jgi:signal transduction histidine kinase
MRLDGLPRSSRSTLVVFLAVALVSTGLLAAFGWRLLKQDQELAETRREERLDKAAATFAAAVQPVLVNGDSVRGAEENAFSLPPGAIVVTLHSDRVSVRDGVLLYYPHEPRLELEAPAQVFEEAERLEFAAADYGGAARAYERLSRVPDAAVRAGALGRLGRVRRRLGDTDEALRHYRSLEYVEQITIDGFPATLFARLGRASALAEAGRSSALRDEARALASDLAGGRWALSRAQYAQRRLEAEEWLGAPPVEDADRLAHAEAVEWLWQRRPTLPATSHLVLDGELPGGASLVVWSSDGDVTQASIAGPTYLAAVEAELRDEASSRRSLLGSAFAAIGLVLLAGWYFILRSMAREGRLLQLQADFVSAVSHEFRSPLTSMAHLAEMLESDRVPPGEVRRASYGVLVRDTNRLRRLVEDLLDFRRLESGSATFRLERLELVELVRSIVSEFSPGVAGAGYQIEIAAPETPLYATADREALARALWNLLDNAIKYSPDCRTVWVEIAREADRIAISVRDQGLGIPLREQRRIFDRFVRGAQPKALRIRGTGIGLALVRHIVRAHGGEVTLASEPGRGSRFTILLPDAAGAGT